MSGRRGPRAVTAPALALALGLGLAPACGRGRPAADAQEGPAPAAATPPAADAEATPDADAAEAEAEARRLREIAHQVVFADRISHAYLLLLPGEGPPPPAPTRAELQQMVTEALPGRADDPEVRLLLAMIDRAPAAAGAGAPRLLEERVADARGDAADPAEVDPGAYVRAAELLALHVDLVAADALVHPEALADPLLTRDLAAGERASLAGRGHALLLRGEYRNQHGVRGLRLLQTLARIVARRLDALIHDPDTLETVGPAVFEARRLQATLGNVADQVAVVPFPDPAAAGRVRLVTRGMRRFGAVDLELAGLPADPARLQRATYLLHGLARVLVGLGEVDRSGIAASAPPEIRVETRDAIAAYAGRPGQLPRCDGCPEATLVHLVERPPEPQDPPGHVVARVVAPRAVSDAPGYDQAAWAEGALRDLFGAPAPAGDPPPAGAPTP